MTAGTVAMGGAGAAGRGFGLRTGVTTIGSTVIGFLMTGASTLIGLMTGFFVSRSVELFFLLFAICETQKLYEFIFLE